MKRNVVFIACLFIIGLAFSLFITGAFASWYNFGSFVVLGLITFTTAGGIAQGYAEKKQIVNKSLYYFLSLCCLFIIVWFFTFLAQSRTDRQIENEQSPQFSAGQRALESNSLLIQWFLGLITPTIVGIHSAINDKEDEKEV